MTPSARRNDCSFEGAIERRIRRTGPVKPRITIFARSYPPAYLRGGPARSVHALVEALVAEFTFSVITSAFDDLGTGPMQSIEQSRWTTFGGAAVWYEAGRHMPIRRLVKLLKETGPELIYLNSLFDYRFAVLPLLISRIAFRRLPILLAPRGELSAGALALKRRKKRAFIIVFRLLKFHKAITWHVSTSLEKADVVRVFGPKVGSHIAIDLRTGLFRPGGDVSQAEWTAGDARGGSLVFYSRIVPKKNIATLIKAMRLLNGSAHLSIAGPVEDIGYWNHCLELIRATPDAGMFKYLGTVPAEEAVPFLSRFDLFVFPTLGENFGHVVLESLAAGTPVIVGKDTPWDRIESSGAGWVCDSTSPEAVAELIEHFLSLDNDARRRMRVAAHNLALEMLNDPGSLDASRSMFHTLTCGDSS